MISHPTRPVLARDAAPAAPAVAPSRIAAGHDNPVRGMSLMIGAVFLFASMDALVKMAAETYPTGQIVFFRNFVAFLPPGLGDLSPGLPPAQEFGDLERLWPGLLGATPPIQSGN